MKTKECKYVWTTKEFDSWIKEQQKQLEQAGFKTSTAGVTHKLLNEVLIPKKIGVSIPKMTRRRKKR